MQGFVFNHGREWVLENLFRDGFITEKPDGSKLTWHTIYRGKNILKGCWKDEDGKIISSQSTFLHENGITEVRQYSIDVANFYWLYLFHRKSKNVIEVTRTDKDGKETKYRVVAKRDRSRRVTSYKIQFSKENFISVSPRYNEKGLLVEEEFQPPDETTIIEYKYSDQGVILLQREKAS